MVTLFQDLPHAHIIVYSKREISNIPTVTPTLLNQSRRISIRNVSVTRYKSVIKNGNDWSPASNTLARTRNVPDDVSVKNTFSY